jgi:hypothetical protein
MEKGEPEAEAETEPQRAVRRLPAQVVAVGSPADEEQTAIAARALPVPPVPRVPQPNRQRPHPRPGRELGNQPDHQVPGLKLL